MGSDLRTIMDTLRENIRLVILCVAAALLLGTVYVLRTPPSYRAEAVLQVEQEERGITLNGSGGEDLRSLEVLLTIEQSLTSPGLLMNVIRAGGLTHDRTFLPEVTRPASEEALQEALAKKIRARVRSGSRLIDLWVEDRDPRLAKKIAYLVIEQFVRQGFRARVKFAQGEHAFMMEEAGRLREKLEKSEEALQEYREQTHSVLLEDKENIVVGKLKEMNRRVTEANAARLRLETDHALLEQMSRSKPERLLTVASVAASAPVLELQRNIQLKEAEIGTLGKRYKPLHPRYIAATSELAELREGLDRAVIKGAEGVEQSYRTALATEAELERALKEQEKLALELSRKTIAYTTLSSEVASDRALYEAVLKRLKETDITRNIVRNAVRVVSPPMALDHPVQPRKARVMALALVGGLGIGCGLALLGRSMDRSLRTVDEAEQLLDEVPVLAVVPLARRVRSFWDGVPLVYDPASATAESFRTLRASLFLMNRGGRGRTVLFTSAVPNDGKSFCAINTAVAHAQQGVSTLLIDADLRLPSVGRIFFGEKEMAGLSEVLSEGRSPGGLVLSSGIENLSILGAGAKARKAAELLARGGIEQVIHWAARNYQCVVIDTAPVNAVSDTLLMVGHVETTCLVVRANNTSADDVAVAYRKLCKAGAVMGGFVFNGVRRFRVDDYSGYYHAYRGDQLESTCVAELADAGGRNGQHPLS